MCRKQLSLPSILKLGFHFFQNFLNWVSRDPFLSLRGNPVFKKVNLSQAEKDVSEETHWHFIIKKPIVDKANFYKK